MRALIFVTVCAFASPAWAQSDCWPNCPQDQTVHDSIWADQFPQRPPLPNYDLPDVYQPPPEPQYYQPAIIYQMPTVGSRQPCPPDAPLSSCY